MHRDEREAASGTVRSECSGARGVTGWDGMSSRWMVCMHCAVVALAGIAVAGVALRGAVQCLTVVNVAWLASVRGVHERPTERLQHPVSGSAVVGGAWRHSRL